MGANTKTNSAAVILRFMCITLSDEDELLEMALTSSNQLD